MVKHSSKLCRLTSLSIVVALSNHPSTVAGVGASSSSQGGMIIRPPPPPPPPPPPSGSEKLSSLLSFGSPEVTEGSDGSSSVLLASEPASMSLLEEKPDDNDDDDGWNAQAAETTTATISGGDDGENRIPSTAASKDDSIEVRDIWGDDGGGGSSQQQWQQPFGGSTPPTHEGYYYPEEQPLGSEQQTTSQYYADGHHDHRRWQQQQQPQEQSWGQSYPHQMQQQHYYQQQQQYQQQQLERQRHPYQNEDQIMEVPGRLQRSGQLALLQQHNRSPPLASHATAAAARGKISAASGLFSRAVKKLQTSIDVVSETLDAKARVATSTVSTLTSRVGGTIGGAIAGGGPSLARNVGGHNAILAANGPRRPTSVAGDARMMVHPHQTSPNRQQRAGQGDIPTTDPRRKTTTPPPGPGGQSRPAIKGTYAPPMSELFSFENEPKNDEVHDNDGGYIDADYDDISGPHSVDDDANSSDDEEEYPDVTTPQWQSLPKQSSHPFLKNDPPRLEIHPSSSTGTPPPHPTVRSSPPPPSSIPARLSTDSRRTDSRRVYRAYDDDDDDDGSSLGRKIKSALGMFIPRMPRLFRRNSGMYDDGSWSDDESRESRRPRTRDHHLTSLRSDRSSPIVPRPVQSLLDKRETLLSAASARSCASFGRTQAVLDACQLALVVSMLREAVPLFFRALSSSVSPNAEPLRGDIRRAVISSLLSSALDGWAPYALAATLLLSASDGVWIQPALRAAYANAALENTSDAAYAQLYLRLTTSIPMLKSNFLSDLIKEATRAQALQVASLARLRSFVALAALYVLLSTVAVLRPAVVSVASTMVGVIRLDVWKDSTIDWKNLLDGMTNLGSSLAQSLFGLIGTEMKAIRQQPLRVVMVVSILTSLIAVSYLPSLEKRRKSSLSPPKRVIGDIDGEENEDEDATITSLWSSAGSSSATRLRLLSSPRGVEGALEQIAKLRPDSAAAAGISIVRQPSRLPRRKKKRSRNEDFSQMLTKVLYSTSSLIILSAPLAIYIFCFASIHSSDGTNWVPLLELASLLAFTHLRAAHAIKDAIQCNIQLGQSSVNAFFQKLAEAEAELRKLASESSSGADLQAMLTASPTKGITVSDLWAAHSSRRAWAVKGANINCQNGEVCIIIGEDGSGKTRLLTAIVEHMFPPPKSARTTTHVRGSIYLAGVDTSKWDRNQLQKRVGVLLNDVRTVSDYASLMAGCTLEEILEPVLAGGRAGPKERNSMSAAMKVSFISKLS